MHFPHVLLLLSWFLESLLTDFALVRVDLFVHCPLVPQTSATVSEALFAESARERLQTTVNSLVPLQVTFLSEALSAFVAAERLLSRVHSLVFLKIGSLVERFCTDSALERLFSIVDPHVTDQISIAPEAAPTRFALM